MESREDQVQPQEGIKKVAICGFAESFRRAPFDDPTVEVWGLNELHKYLPRWNRWFEVHDADTLGVTKRNLDEGEQKRHLEWLSKDYGANRPIYMQPQFCDGRFPNAVPLPLDALVNRIGLRYFTSTIGFMVGMALLDNYQWIGLYGIDLASDIEYQQQRANTEYLIGIARGEGREVVLAETSAICRAGHIYGFEQPLGQAGGIANAVRAHQDKLKKKHEETLALLNTLDGAMQETENTLKLFDYKERGCAIPVY